MEKCYVCDFDGFEKSKAPKLSIGEAQFVSNWGDSLSLREIFVALGIMKIAKCVKCRNCNTNYAVCPNCNHLSENDFYIQKCTRCKKKYYYYSEE